MNCKQCKHLHSNFNRTGEWDLECRVPERSFIVTLSDKELDKPDCKGTFFVDKNNPEDELRPDMFD